MIRPHFNEKIGSVLSGTKYSKNEANGSESNYLLLDIMKKTGDYIFDDGKQQFRSKSEKKRYIESEKEIRKLRQMLKNSPNKRQMLSNV